MEKRTSALPSLPIKRSDFPPRIFFATCVATLSSKRSRESVRIVAKNIAVAVFAAGTAAASGVGGVTAWRWAESSNIVAAVLQRVGC